MCVKEKVCALFCVVILLVTDCLTLAEEKIEFQFNCGDVELCIFPDQFCSSDSYTCMQCTNSICAAQNIPLQCLFKCRKRIREEETCHMIQAWHVVLYCAVTAVATSVITGFVCVLRQKKTCRRTDDDNNTDEDNNLIGNHERGEYCRSRLTGIPPTNGDQQTTFQESIEHEFININDDSSRSNRRH